MEIEHISNIGGAAVVAAYPPAHNPLFPSLRTPTPLAEARAIETETTEQLASNGDPVALAQLVEEQNRQTPITAQQLLPLAVHPPGAHEPGKGDIIDIYD